MTILTLTKVDVGMLEDVGTSANNIIQLDSNGKIPAVDGSLLTGVDTSLSAASDPTISTNPSGGVGTKYKNTTSGEMYICTDASAGENVWTNVGPGSGDVSYGWGGSRGVIGGGRTSSDVTTIEYVTIATIGNAVDFGDLTVARRSSGSCSSGTRGIWAGGNSGGNNVIDYITISTLGNATDFGDCQSLGKRSALSSGTRGVFGGGEQQSGSYTGDTTIDYVTIATPGNSTDFGDLTSQKFSMAGVSSGTRGVFGGGRGHVPSWSNKNEIDYITIATTGNAIDFGDLTAATKTFGSFDNITRGVWGGGDSGSYTNKIEYITIATTGNGTDFGDLTTARGDVGGASNAIRGIFCSGYNSNVIDYIIITTLGNATDFGDLTALRGYTSACSGD